ncbi:hypothetical protein MMC14_009075 [Varicellaria rhodocarpa]|nr:hypothetical protein [Varicellaria rhodocarpa]
MTTLLWKESTGWTAYGGTFPIPISLRSAADLFLALDHGKTKDAGESIGETVPDLAKYETARLSAILLSITGGANEIGRKEGEVDFTIDDTTINKLLVTIRPVMKKYEQLNKWMEIVKEKNCDKAIARFDDMITRQSPYTVKMESGYLDVAWKDPKKNETPPIDPRKKPFQDLVRHLFTKVNENSPEVAAIAGPSSSN